MLSNLQYSKSSQAILCTTGARQHMLGNRVLTNSEPLLRDLKPLGNLAESEMFIRHREHNFAA